MKTQDNLGCNYYWETVNKITKIWAPDKIKFIACDIRISEAIDFHPHFTSTVIFSDNLEQKGSCNKSNLNMTRGDVTKGQIHDLFDLFNFSLPAKRNTSWRNGEFGGLQSD